MNAIKNFKFLPGNAISDLDGLVPSRARIDAPAQRPLDALDRTLIKVAATA
jgi:hypothetical protein